MRTRTILLTFYPLLTPALQIAFQTESQSLRDVYTFQPAFPQGISCYAFKSSPSDIIVSIKTLSTPHAKRRPPDAIGFFKGKKCSAETLRFVVFYYQPGFQAVEQSFDLGELPALFREFDHYREIREDTLEWMNLLGDAAGGNSLNKGDVVYKLTDGRWDTLPNVVEVTADDGVPRDWYLSQGLRKSTLRKGNYLGQFTGQPVTDFMRSRTADAERDESQKLLRSKSRKEWRKNTADEYTIEKFKITPNPILFSKSRISEAGSPYSPGFARKSLSPLLGKVTKVDNDDSRDDDDEGNVEMEDTTDSGGRVSIPQLLTMNRIMPHLPRIPADNEGIIPEDSHRGITHSYLQNTRPIKAGKSTADGKINPGVRNMYSS
ncbi:hypothetical protein TWF481_000172 [Arthrobotrys musiformis]|uniref:Uncharacterized protein n=1 Tax=Arthrobotrys musiformis TaxID=47236 RepID=A0AAV9WLY1_9PEZI